MVTPERAAATPAAAAANTAATGILGTAAVGLDFIFAGGAIFTVSSPSGQHYTYRVSRKEAEPGSRWGDEPTFFVGLLAGPRNTADYAYVGIADRATGEVRTTRKSRHDAASTPVKVIGWVLKLMVRERPLPDGYEVRHAGRCGVCGRVLTDPESIDSGIGPICAAKRGA